MSVEIEHKYLVKDLSFKRFVTKSIHICQGYLSKDKERTVRIRIAGDQAFITIKGKTKGDTRAEYEYPIPVNEAKTMLDTLCIPPIIEKYRYIVPFEGDTWEIDEFCGSLSGLILAEIEIPSSDYQYKCPPFIGVNVTGNPKYYNSNLTNIKP